MASQENNHGLPGGHPDFLPPQDDAQNQQRPPSRHHTPNPFNPFQNPPAYPYPPQHRATHPLPVPPGPPQGPRLIPAHWGNQPQPIPAQQFRYPPFQMPQQPPQQIPAGFQNYPHTRHMPGRFDRSAPQFDGDPRSLRRFFDEIDLLARDCGLSQRDTITHTLRYLGTNNYDIWASQPSASGDDWLRFKADITALYPGAEESARYTVTDLENFVEISAASPMQDRLQFGDYYRKFVTITAYLTGRGVLSHRERNKYFMSGFHITFRQQLRNQLRMQNPLHPLDEPWDIHTVERAARFLLEGTSTGGILNSSISPSTHLPRPIHNSTIAPVIPVPRETFDMTSLEQFFTSDAFINRLAGRIAAPTHNNTQPSYSSPTRQNPSDRRENWACGFCSDPNHMFRACERLNEYLSRGLCRKNESGQLCMPDGTIITRQVAPGRNMKERIDNWHQQRTSQPSRVQANLLEVFPLQRSTENASTALPNPTTSSIPFPNDHVDEELRRLEAIVLATQKRQDELKKRKGISNKPQNAPQQSVQIPNRSQPPPTIPTSPPIPSTSKPSHNPNPSTPSAQDMSKSVSKPQYRNAAAIEDPKTIQDVAQRSLEGTITITTKELYAIAPEVRNHVRSQINPHRIPNTTSTLVSLQENNPSSDQNISEVLVNHIPHSSSPPLVVANPAESLRTIPLELDGKFTVEAILDEGSQIVALRRDLWEKLGSPVHCKDAIVMESANATTEPTLGLIRDLPVRIGTCTLYLQVQVIENAPYEMLLGRPFLTLTQACTHHYPNGHSHLTLIDPNTRESVTIPTQPRIRSSPTANEGF
ncbi:hypothetical protein NP233_g3931 [Leucocoprinus birnbaumii]|uniref:CCHC-type domain-containing protein n=1 Tax=Leucocoprinus birnbaumii TaxID=56174 RepID=A0AAD5YW09_9AGAR|nr:hypothetical protein NP233_g3931 [Leucocoprinus birnbaumii]